MERRIGLMAWVRAWHDVLRNPDKQIPHPEIPPQGEPLPADLDLHCPECGYNLTGLKEWRCPECGGQFNPYRVHTLGMLRRPEYILRYRFDARDLRRIFWIVVVLAGTVPAIWLTVKGITAGSDMYAIYARGQYMKLLLFPLAAIALTLARSESTARSFLVLSVILFIMFWTAAWLL